MPLLILLRRLRLPSRSEAALIGLALLVLLFASWLRRGEKIAALEAELAAKPLVEERTRLVRVEAPVKVVTKYLEGRVVERVIERGTVTTERASEHKETPICLAQAARHDRFIGVLIDPLSLTKVNGARGGMTFFGRIDAAASVRVSNAGATSIGGDLSWRF